LLLVIGGAIGNIIDRVRFGSVIDFVDVYFGDWHYPAFNFADSCIVIGVLLLLLNTLLGEKKEEAFSLKKNK
ncbi:MAG: signal peptidase II, partial [Pseudomonadota bacterium]|nr:signal peptidase II [Pseudomonadota bacterium]